MTYDSPLSAFGGKVIPEVASFIEEGLVIPEEWDQEKGKLEIWWFKGEFNPGLLHEMQEIDVRWSRLEQSVLWNKSSLILHSFRLRWSILAIRADLNSEI